MKDFKVIRRYIRILFAVEKEEDPIATYEEIREGVIFKGYNLWILGFAMVIATIGLTVDSLSALIGAMLISPLMGPIIGLAFAMAVNDNYLKRISLKNWLLMTFISLIAAVLFFMISPFDDDTNALASFKKASIFDIFLAFFGGMAGFIGIIKKEGTKILAGVAVATACMPPLCTAAYGIAHFDYKFFIGGLYFYLINCLFIGLATFILARYFGYHRGKHLTDITPTTRWAWNIFIVLMLLPSIYIAYQKWNEQHTVAKIDSDKVRIEKLERKVQALDSLLQIKK